MYCVDVCLPVCPAYSVHITTLHGFASSSPTFRPPRHMFGFPTLQRLPTRKTTERISFFAVGPVLFSLFVAPSKEIQEFRRNELSIFAPGCHQNTSSTRTGRTKQLQCVGKQIRWTAARRDRTRVLCRIKREQEKKTGRRRRARRTRKKKTRNKTRYSTTTAAGKENNS